MRMKGIICVLVSVVTMLGLSACSAPVKAVKKGYVYSVDTGEKIRIVLDDADGLNLSDDNGSFHIRDEKNKDIITGFFQSADYFDTMHAKAESGSSYQILIDEPESFIYTVYIDGGWKTNYVLRLIDSDTTVCMTSSLESDEAKAVYDKLEFILVQ